MSMGPTATAAGEGTEGDKGDRGSPGGRSSPASSDPGFDPAGRPRVLLVEDDFLVSMELEEGLREAGCRVTGIASSAEQAVAMAEADRPTLVVMDIRLTGARDGVDAALEIHRRLGIRSIFASAHGDAAVRARAAAADPLGWIAKPYRVPLLVAAVRTALAALAGDPRPTPLPTPTPGR